MQSGVSVNILRVDVSFVGQNMLYYGGCIFFLLLSFFSCSIFLAVMLLLPEHPSFMNRKKA